LASSARIHGCGIRRRQQGTLLGSRHRYGAVGRAPASRGVAGAPHEETNHAPAVHMMALTGGTTEYTGFGTISREAVFED
jgi:hypothetical protein